jgi:hypothetical protein
MGMTMGLNLKMTIARAGIRLAWWMIYTGRDIWEAAEPKKISWASDRMVSFGHQLERAGEALEGRIDALANRWGLDIAEVLRPLVDARMVQDAA